MADSLVVVDAQPARATEMAAIDSRAAFLALSFMLKNLSVLLWSESPESICLIG
jgi:hypothetical protein